MPDTNVPAPHPDECSCCELWEQATPDTSYPPRTIADHLRCYPLTVDDAQELFKLAVETEDRTDNEHDALKRLARWLDEQADSGAEVCWYEGTADYTRDTPKAER